MITETIERMESAFNEWALRYAKNPDEFENILNEDGSVIDDYGKSCVVYLQKILKELKT